MSFPFFRLIVSGHRDRGMANDDNDSDIYTMLSIGACRRHVLERAIGSLNDTRNLSLYSARFLPCKRSVHDDLIEQVFCLDPWPLPSIEDEVTRKFLSQRIGHELAHL